MKSLLVKAGVGAAIISRAGVEIEAQKTTGVEVGVKVLLLSVKAPASSFLPFGAVVYEPAMLID